MKLFILAGCVLAFTLYSFGQKQNKIAIIGGGIAGTSTAYYIKKADLQAQVVLFEKEKQLGGNAYTVSVPNARNEYVKVDIGPQYFCKGPWDDYIRFLDETLGWKNIQTESMVGSLQVQKQGEKRPQIITPLNGSLRGEKLSNLLQMKKFNDAAFAVYKTPEPWHGKSIEDWVSHLDFNTDYKDEVLYPFLAASLGTTVADIKQTAAVEIIQLFGFRKPKLNNRFFIMQDGMGELIQQIGQKIEQNGVNIQVDATVLSMVKWEKKYILHYSQNQATQIDTFDYVVLGVHADQALKLLDQEPSLQIVCESLKKLPYFTATIVVHKDKQYIDSIRPTFLNIATNTQNELIYSTMNLSVISKRLDGIYKSWLSPQHVDELTSSGKILYTKTFYHPYISTTFVQELEKLRQLNENLGALRIVGGWLMGIETQNSAVVSAKEAVRAYQKFKSTQ